MEIKLGNNLGLAGFRHPFTKANERFDLGKGLITVSGNNVAGYCTTIPFSDAGYRKQHPTKARAEYTLNNGWHEFAIWDDWGKRHEVLISDDEDGRMLAAVQVESLRANGML